MSEGIETLWREYESLATATESGASSTLAPWITREQVTVQCDVRNIWQEMMKTSQEFFASYGLSSQHVKMIAGMGLMVTCFTLVIVLFLICSRKLRDTQVRMRMEDVKMESSINELF